MYDPKASIVFDNGTGTVKVGFGGQEKPSHLIPSYVSIPLHRGSMFDEKQVVHSGNLLAGEKAVKQAQSGDFKLRCPMQHGVVKSTEDMTALWTHTYDLLAATPSDHPVLLTETPSNPKKSRNQMITTFFEDFQVPSLFIAEQATLALYASGRTTGVVLDSGHGVTHCVPIFEGFDLPEAVVRLPVAGLNITRHLIRMLKRSGVHFHRGAELAIVQDIKEKVCSVRIKEVNRRQTEEPMIFQLPDGKKIKIGKTTREGASEVLFNPASIGLEFGGIHECVADAIEKTELDGRRTLWSSIVLAGGSTMLKGFGGRLLSELEAINIPKGVKFAERSNDETGFLPTKPKVKIFAPTERHLSTWIGGSIICSMSEESNFKGMWISQEQFKEHGLNLR